MKYISDDGKKIGTKEEIETYETKLAAEKAEKEKLDKEKQGRLEEIKTGYETLIDKIEKYNKDYKESAPYIYIRTPQNRSNLPNLCFDPFSLLNRFDKFWW